jgi:hypothetical protein
MSPPAGADNDYAQAMRALDQKRWEEALAGFSRVAAERGARSDAALYWCAYTQNKLGHRDEALKIIGEIRRQYAQSRWLNDAKALEVELLAAAGRPVEPAQTADEDLKLMALNGLMQNDPERATAMIEKMLAGPSGPKVKQRALFVLAQSGSPKARETLLRLARNNANPELQRQAVRNLGIFAGKESAVPLGELYRTSSDLALRREILRGFMVSGNKLQLAEAAKGEKNPELRHEAINLLGTSGDQKTLQELLVSSTDASERQQILGALMVAGGVDSLVHAARTDRDLSTRVHAVQMLGVMPRGKTADALSDIYRKSPEPEIRRAVIRAFFTQGNAKTLVGLARNEKDASLKTEAVRMLSLMKSKEARDYMLEILEK